MDYNALKVADLKGLLKERGIPSTGLSRKQQIIEALESHDANGGGKQDSGEADADEVSGQTGDELVAEAADGDSAAVPDANNDAIAPDDETEKDGQDTETATIPVDVTQESTTSQPQHESEQPAPEVSSAQPTVLESNRPVSKEPSALPTPRQASPVAESTSSDRKRKRRSPTPPVDEETVNKKIKAADEGVATLPEDGAHGEGAIEKAPLPDTVKSEQMSDPAGEDMDIDPIEPQSDVKPNASIRTDGAADEQDSVEKSMHPPTRAIYICNLVRPIQPGQISDHLTRLAVAPGDKLQHENLDNLHLGSIRTHAFAVFNTTPTAVQVRSRLHGQVWPDEPARKALWVDFVPEDKVQKWIDRENDGGGRRDIRRWEVVYDETDNGIVARHQELTAGSAAPDRRPSNISTSGNGMGMPNAPLGPRSSRPAVPTIPSQPPQQQPAKQSTPNPTSSASFVVLDEKFPSTIVKPKLYYLPVTKDLADRRMDELERQTSREWGARGGEVAGAEVRRYTFEDGDRIVDGGPHYDDFSGPRGGGGGGGGRRRGGGGFRGRR